MYYTVHWYDMDRLVPVHIWTIPKFHYIIALLMNLENGHDDRLKHVQFQPHQTCVTTGRMVRGKEPLEDSVNGEAELRDHSCTVGTSKEQDQEYHMLL
jgi:hypothetical protein